ncbi:hypothetical protein BA723_04755, partial [Helicobacter sp. CLO-3]|uniref:DUF354 domain-containing protein n=2 Tax=Helicobacter TaxID=209 RepID=UPI000805AE13
MIWIDITDPKYALFFHAFLPKLLTLDNVLITTRKSEGYEECANILEMLQIDSAKPAPESNARESNTPESSTHKPNSNTESTSAPKSTSHANTANTTNPATPTHTIQIHCVGGYGGGSFEGKLRARMQRQEAFLTLFASLNIKPRVFLTGASVEGAQCAYGLGIPVIHFSDTPLAGHRFSARDITLLSRLTLPLSSLVFHPFVIPSSVYSAFGLDMRDVYAYDFIDIALWLVDSVPKSKAQNALESSASKLDSARESKAQTKPPKSPQKPLIIAREEEYKAHYVKQKLSLWYESVHALARRDVAQILIIPRYEREYLHREFGAYACVEILEEPLPPLELYARADMMLGGGGTMNLEACFLGIPTISTRSLLLFHDMFLIENGLMTHAKTLDEVLRAFEKFRTSGFSRQNKQNLFVKSSVLNSANSDKSVLDDEKN